jgi:hypothetical protein
MVLDKSCKEIFDCLNSFFSYSDESEEIKNVLKVKMIAFSDSILRFYDVSDQPFGYLLFEAINIGMIQCMRVFQKTLIRGCLSFGDFYSSGNIFFGNAFVDAYEYESKCINYPVIAIHPKIIEIIELKGYDYNLLVKDKEINYLKSIIKNDNNLNYIDYLSVLISMIDNQETIKGIILSHKNLIENELRSITLSESIKSAESSLKCE